VALVEAELKAVVRDVNAVRTALSQRAPAYKSTYADRYFGYPDRRLTEQERELRVRTITDDSGQTRVLLTCKEPALDAASRPIQMPQPASADGRPAMGPRFAPRSNCKLTNSSYAFRDPAEVVILLIPCLGHRVAVAIGAHQTGRTTYLEYRVPHVR
jgi:hypothetical protein